MAFDVKITNSKDYQNMLEHHFTPRLDLMGKTDSGVQQNGASILSSNMIKAWFN